jgi:subtilase family serine protease
LDEAFLFWPEPVVTEGPAPTTSATAALAPAAADIVFAGTAEAAAATAGTPSLSTPDAGPGPFSSGGLAALAAGDAPGNTVATNTVWPASALGGVAPEGPAALVAAADTAVPGGHLQTQSSTGTSTGAGYTPAQIRHAYGFDQIPSLTSATDPNYYNENAGKGQTIAIVDAYNDPNILGDVNTFSSQFSLPLFNNGSGSPTFTKVNQKGSASGPFPLTSSTWAGEVSLDVEWAHAIAPAASIVLVEASSASTNNLLAAIDTARNYPGVSTVSMSWGLSEGSGEAGVDAAHLTTPTGHVPITFVAATLDDGTTHPSSTFWPSVSPMVLAVGGTTLTLNPDNSYGTEVAWSASTGGLSLYETQPAYQNGFVSQSTTYRAVPDVAYHADNTTHGFAVYDTVPYGGQTGWFNAYGDSAGAPQWAALVSIADQQRATALAGAGQVLPGLYNLARSNYSLYFHDITAGSNGKHSAGPGYDLVTGLGTPKADQLVPALVSL